MAKARNKDSDARRTEREEGTRERIPFSGRRYRLQLSDKDMKGFEKSGYVVHWFNDLDGRVERALSGGYEFVAPQEAPSVGQGAITEGNTDLGDKVSKIVSRGDPVIRAYLMKIKKKYYDEDQEEKEKINRRVDDALAGGEAGGASVENKYGPGVTYSK